MKLQNLTLYLFALLAVISCIALEDEFSPTVTDNTITDKIYYYRDSLHVDIAFRDNVLIEEGKVKIHIVDTESVLNDSVIFAFDTTYTDVGARLLKFDSLFLIPSYVRTGKYLLEVKNTDTGENQIADTSYFYIGTDTLAPVIENFSVSSAIEGNQENETLCRGERITVNAKVTDNVDLKRIGVKIGEGSARYFNVIGNSLNVVEIVQRQLFISDSLTNGTYDLTLIAEDQFGNVSEDITQINISCDDQPALFVSYKEESGIIIPSNRIVTLYPGEQFTMSSLIFKDNGGLDSARLEITRIGIASDVGEDAPTVHDTPVMVALGGVLEVDLATLFKEDFNFGFDLANTQAGETIFVNIKVKDNEQTWENASFFRFSMVAKEDLAPVIRITDLIIAGTKEYVPEDVVKDLTQRLVGNQSIDIAVEGKIDENVGLASIEYTFDSDNRLVQGFGGSINTPEEFTSYPVDIGTVLATTFPIYSNVNYEGDILYTLKIKATDIKGQKDSVTYNFNVSYPIE